MFENVPAIQMNPIIQHLKLGIYRALYYTDMYRRIRTQLKLCFY